MTYPLAYFKPEGVTDLEQRDELGGDLNLERVPWPTCPDCSSDLAPIVLEAVRLLIMRGHLRERPVRAELRTWLKDPETSAGLVCKDCGRLERW